MLKLFKRKERTEEEILEEKLHQEEARERDEGIQRGLQVELFPGSLEEYQLLKGEEYCIIDTGSSDKSVYFECDIPACNILGRENYRRSSYISSENDALQLNNIGAEAVINYHIIIMDINMSGNSIFLTGMGIPVKRK